MNQKLNKKIRFSEQTSAIIQDLIGKYNLTETTEEILEKIGKDQLSNGEIITGLVREYCKNKIDIKELSFNLKEELNISEINAMSLAQDIHEKILPEVISPKSIPEKETKQEIKTEPIEEPKSLSEDSYREPID